MMFPIAIYGLLYGDFHALHWRLIDSLLCIRDPAVRVTLWCNQVCDETLAYLKATSIRVYASDDNIPKYRAMRQMFSAAVPEPWLVWFDDDAYITAPDWLPTMRRFIAQRKSQNVCYIGEPWRIQYFEGEWDFIRQAAWYRGKPPHLIPSGAPGIEFAQGSYWWLRTDVARLLDWPDPRLKHNGGDSLLGEAIRQNGLPLHHSNYGVKINDAPRRGHHEAPAGARDPNARR